MVPGTVNPHGGELPAATVSLQHSAEYAGAAAGIAWTGVSYGAEAETRKLLAITFAGGAARTLDEFTCDSVEVERLLVNSYFAVGIIDKPTGASGIFRTIWNGTKSSQSIAVYRTTNQQFKTPVDGGFTAFSSLVASRSLLIPAGGFALGHLYGGGSSSRTVTWSGVTEGFDTYIRTLASHGYAEMHSGGALAYSAQQAAQVVSATLSGDLVDSKSAYIWSFR